jgi:23S rRNA pseudouridine1911/1915/1917 synthase
VDTRDKRYDQFVVEHEDTLLNWLLAHIKESRTKIKATLSGHGVRVNGKIISKFDYPLAPGMKIAVSKSKKNDTFKNKYVKIVYEDKFLVVLEKNVGILSMAGGHRALNVKAVLDDYFQKTHQKCRAHVVHRLDRDTSGLMIYAKDMKTEQVLEHEWHQIVFDRRYVAVLSGEVEPDEGTIANWLKDNKAYVTYSSPVDNGGKYAVTHFFTLDRKDGRSLVEFRLETGRKNQIRVHMKDLGHPVAGDSKYGNGRNPIGRLALHAYRLFFFHPITGLRMEFETPLPPAFLHVFNRNEAYNIDSQPSDDSEEYNA